MKKLLIFDLDGTLLNTLEDLKNSVNYALQEFNYPTKNLEQIRNYIGNGVEKLIERSIPDGKNNPNFNKCLDIFKIHYKENMYNKTKPFEGIIDMLKKLKEQKFIIAISSNKFDEAVKKLSKKYFGDLIDFAIGENSKKGIHKKPSADSINIILNEYCIKKSEVLYIGDSEIDIQTATNAGIECLSVSWGYKDEDFLIEHGAQYIIKKPKEIISYVLT